MKICLDAGHYKGYNQGVVKSYYEGNVVWKLTNLQKKYLEEYENVTVILTRADISKDLSLSARGNAARGCDLFISNHSNSADKETVDRPVIIYPYDNKNKADVLGKKLGEKIQTVMGLQQKYQMYQRTHNGGEYYGVMRGARAIGCPRYYILEHGFHSNKATCNWLLKDENLEKLAKAEVEVIAEYYGLKKKVSTTTTDSAKKVNYVASIIADSLNVRKGAGTSFDVVEVDGKKLTLKKGDAYTIIEEKNGWGKLKSGVGWINVSEKYVAKK
jgi:N-acetylmuramoyl-L-alanine amidase